MIRNFRKSGMLALILLALCSTTAIAATTKTADTSVSVVGAESSGYDYPTFPSQETVTKDIGFTPKMAEKLSDDFSFRRGFIDPSYGKALALEYTKAGATEAQTVRVFVNNLDTPIEGGITINNGSNPRLFYYQEEFEGNKIQRVMWKDNSLNYILAVNNYGLSKEQLKAMANMVIEQK